DKGQHVLDKFWQMWVHLVRIKGSLRPGRDVDHAGIFAQHLVDVRDARILAAGEHVDLDAAPSQFAAQIAHVDVHAAGFLAAKHGQRAGVHAQHRDSAYRLHRLPFLYAARIASRAMTGWSCPPIRYLYSSLPRRKSNARLPCSIAYWIL